MHSSLHSSRRIHTVAVAALLVVATAASGCSTDSEPSGEVPRLTSSATPTDESGLRFDSAKFSVSVDDPAAASSSTLTASETRTAPKGAEDFLDTDPVGVNLSYTDNAQPAEPLMLHFDLTRDPQFASAADAVPVVLALPDGANQPEILRSTWDPDTRTLSAPTTHLTTFWPAVIKTQRVFERLGGAADGFFGTAFPRPDCVGQPVVVGSTTYSLDPTAVPAAWPCINAAGDSIAVTVHSNSPNGWLLQSTPDTDDMAPVADGSVAGVIDAAAYETIFANALGNGTYLTPGGTTTLTFPQDQPPQQVTLHSDPGMTLLHTATLGLQALYPNSKILEIPGVASCVHTLWSQPQYRDDATGAAFGNLTRGLSDCVVEATKNLKPTNVGAAANASLGSLLALVPDAVNALVSNVRGALAPFIGESNQVINVRTSQDAPARPVDNSIVKLTTKITDNGAGFELGPNQFQISKTFEDDGRYYADTNYNWKIERPEGSDLGYCKGHVTITAADREIARYDDTGFNACKGGGAFATNTKIFDPGLYTVTAQIEFERGPTLAVTQDFTVDQ